MSINLKIISPSGTFLNKKVDLITACAAKGYIGIMKNHLPFVSSLKVSKFSYTLNNQKEEFAVGGGIIICSANEVVAITESIIAVKNINVVLEEARRKKIQAVLKEKQSKTHFNQLQVELQDAINRINIKNSKTEPK